MQSLGLSSHYSLLESEENISSYLLFITGISETQALQELNAKPGVAFAELNTILHVFFEPNDPLWTYQYGPTNIQCPAAWDTERGEHTVVVSVIDTGIDYTHSDLVNCYRAFGSWNFVARNGNPLDDNGHGTHCAGIIAAETNNGIGIAGIANVQIMSMKAISSDGTGYIWTVARAIVRSALFGADIISMSLGASPFWQPRLLWLACNFSYALGVTIVAAAGNDGTEWLDYPARFPCVISVGATDSNNERAPFSNYWESLDVVAPGVDIISTMPTYHVALNDPPYSIPMYYANLSGTSMACPHCVGVLALYFSKNGVTVSNEKAKECLHESAIDLGDPGYDKYYGYGLVNAYGILQYDDSSDGGDGGQGHHVGGPSGGAIKVQGISIIPGAEMLIQGMDQHRQGTV